MLIKQLTEKKIPEKPIHNRKHQNHDVKTGQTPAKKYW